MRCQPIMYGWPRPPTWPGSRVPPVSTPNPTCAATCGGALTAAWTRWPHAARTWSSTSGGCRRPAGSSPPPSHGGSRWPPASTAPASSTACWSTPRPSMSVRPNVPAESPTLGFTHLQFEALLTAARESANDYDFALVAMLGLLGLRIFEATGARHRRPRRGTRPPGPARVRQGHQDRPGPAAPGGRPGHRPRHRRPGPRADPAQQPWRPDGPARRHPPPAPSRPARGCTDHPATPPHAQAHFVTTMLDAGVDLRDVQIAARHADPRTTTRYDGPARTSTGTPTTSSPPTWPPAPDTAASPVTCAHGRHPTLPR